jgi:hypothetical protein
VVTAHAAYYHLITMWGDVAVDLVGFIVWFVPLPPLSATICSYCSIHKEYEGLSREIDSMSVTISPIAQGKSLPDSKFPLIAGDC